MMKNILIIITLLVSIGVKAQTQNKLNNVYLNFGITLGDYSYISDQGEIDYKPQIGFRLGADYITFKKDKLSLETGLTLSLLRTKIEQPAVKYSTFYIGTQLMGNYEILEEQLYLGVGSFFDFGLIGRQTYEGGEPIDVFKGQNGNDAPLSRFNYGLDFRVLGNLAIAIPVQAYVSYRLGVANIEGSDSKSGQKFKANIISFGLRSNIQDLFGK
jgi:hypothetical protein